MGFKVVVAGSKAAKAALQSNRCYTSKAGAKRAVERLREKADRMNLYPGAYMVVSCGRRRA